VIDTMAIAERVFHLPVRNLAAVSAALDIHPRPSHRALDDVRATREVLVRGLACLAERSIHTVGEAVEALLPPVGNVPLLGDPLPGVREALRNGLDLRLAYAGGRGDTERTVRPVRLATAKGQVVLAAFCRERQAPREFRLDRILAAEVVTPSV
jgi:predicted DNA-binding transcriptional regulator YafY